MLFFLWLMDSSSRSGGNVGNALLAFSKEEGNPPALGSWGIFLFRHFHRLPVYETLLAGLDHLAGYFDSPTNSATEPKNHLAGASAWNLRG